MYINIVMFSLLVLCCFCFVLTFVLFFFTNCDRDMYIWCYFNAISHKPFYNSLFVHLFSLPPINYLELPFSIRYRTKKETSLTILRQLNHNSHCFLHLYLHPRIVLNLYTVHCQNKQNTRETASSAPDTGKTYNSRHLTQLSQWVKYCCNLNHHQFSWNH